MPAFKKLGLGDQIDNVLVLEPQWDLASGSGGWRGSPEGSASINLYGGHHRTPGGVVQEYRYEPTIPAAKTYGQLLRSNPITASVDLVWMTNEDIDLSQRSRTRWGYEHWKTVDGLYVYYNHRDPDYTTGSYDNYCLFFDSGSQNILTVFDRVGSSPEQHTALPTGSFTLEAWFKPFVTSSLGKSLTLMSHARAYKLFIDGNTGNLMFSMHSGTSAPEVTVTSSIGVTNRRWHHAAVSFDGTTRSGTLYLDLNEVGTFTYSSTGLLMPIGYTGSLQIGADWGGAVVSGQESPAYANGGSAGTVFHGFIGETRVWGTARTWTQISSSYDTSLTGSALGPPLLSNVRLSEGPLSFASPSVDPSGLISGYASGNLMGSGVLDYSARARSVSPDFGVLYKFSDRYAPVWHQSDNVSFYPTKQLVGQQHWGTNWTGSLSPGVQRMLVVHVPSAFYGRQIQPGTVSMTCRTYSGEPYGIVRTLLDDGRGGLFLSGSVCSSSLADKEDYRGVEWNKVGNVFYSEGLITIKDPSLLDFASARPNASAHPSDLLQLSFRGHTRVPVKTVIARIDRGELNRSLNPTYYQTEDDGYRTVRHPSGNLYVTTVGLYNSDRELVGVARLAEPLRVRPRDRFAIKIRMDF